jgi:hypothetical protein
MKPRSSPYPVFVIRRTFRSGQRLLISPLLIVARLPFESFVTNTPFLPTSPVFISLFLFFFFFQTKPILLAKMKAFMTLLPIAATVLASSSMTTATEVAASEPMAGTDTVHGCYSSLGNLVFNQTYSYNSQGACADFCRGLGKPVAASQAKDCYCGTEYPAKNTLVADSECSEPCPGFSSQACGGVDTWTVYNTGVKVSVADSANTTRSTVIRPRLPPGMLAVQTCAHTSHF